MKKTIIALALLLGVCQVGFGQTVEALFGKYKNEKHAEYVNLTPFLFGVAKLFVPSDEGGNMVKRIRSVCVLDMGDCSSSIKERFAREVKQCRFKEYEELMRATEDGEQVRVLLKQKKEVIRDLLVLVTGDDCTMVHIKGKIRKSDLNDLISEHTPKKKKHER